MTSRPPLYYLRSLDTKLTLDRDSAVKLVERFTTAAKATKAKERGVLARAARSLEVALGTREPMAAAPRNAR